MIDKINFHLPWITRRACAGLAATMAFTLLAVATPSPSRADWTEWRGGCSYTCHWYLASATCRTLGGIKVPCPVRKKRCSADHICRQSIQ